MGNAATSSKQPGRGIGSVTMSVVLLLVALLALYVFSYALLVQKGDGLDGVAWNRLYYKPRYRVNDTGAMHRFYEPIHAIDREVRRSYWYATYQW